MNRLILGALHRLRWSIVAAVTVVGITLVNPTRFLPLAGLLSIPLLYSIPILVVTFRRIWPLRHARRFSECRSDRVILRYEPGTEHVFDFERQLRLWEAALDDLEGQFGFKLKRRLLVFLFATSKVPQRLVGRNWAKAAALMGDDIVVVSADSLRTHPAETMRHELAHLLSAAWLRRPVVNPFRDEGLATYLQGTVAGVGVDRWARAVVARNRLRPLAELLQLRGYPDGAAEAFDLYVVAGSFAGHLIRTFGWKSYSQFFRSVQSGNYAKVFRRVFRITLQQAEDQWLEQSLRCSPGEVRINLRLQKPLESLLRTVQGLSTTITKPRRTINIPERLAERHKQLYG